MPEERVEQEVILAAGANEVTVAFTGTVGALRELGADLLGIAPGATATLDGEPVGDEVEVPAGGKVEYSRDSGAKA